MLILALLHFDILPLLNAKPCKCLTFMMSYQGSSAYFSPLSGEATWGTCPQKTVHFTVQNGRQVPHVLMLRRAVHFFWDCNTRTTVDRHLQATEVVLTAGARRPALLWRFGRNIVWQSLPLLPLGTVHVPWYVTYQGQGRQGPKFGGGGIAKG